MTKSENTLSTSNKENDESTNISALGTKPSHVVALGVSAGGLEAFGACRYAVEDYWRKN
jgi:chemotaxis response regulator CheB